MNDRKQKVMDKIRKLLSLANDGRGNETEQATALRQANFLMAQHQIEEADVDMNALAGGTVELDEVEIRPDGKMPGNGRPVVRRMSPHAAILSIGVARFCDCIAKRKRGLYGEVLGFAGERSDVELAIWIFPYLLEQIEIAQKLSGWTKRGEAVDFRRSAASTLQKRLSSLARERREMYQKAQVESGSRAMVVVDQKAMLIAEKYGEQRVVKSRTSVHSYDARDAGRDAGSRIHIPTNRPLEGGQKRLN